MLAKNIDPSFKDRLQRVMRELDMTQADVSRKIWGVTFEKRADGNVYEVAKNRQAIGRYLSGKSYPSEGTKLRLAEALGVTFHELFPNDEPVNRAGSGITLQPVNKKESILIIHVTMPTKKAQEVIDIVSEYAQ